MSRKMGRTMESKRRKCSIISLALSLLLAFQSEVRAQLELTSAPMASFQTDFIIENIGDEPIDIYKIIVNKDEWCVYQIWVKMDRSECKSIIPGTGGFLAIGGVKGLHYIVPQKTLSMSESKVEAVMKACGWEKRESITLGTESKNYRFKFSLFRDNDNGQQCFNHRTITIDTSDGLLTWRSGPNPRY